MQTTATRTAGSHTDLLTGILNVQVRNEDKITEQDRQYCQLQPMKERSNAAKGISDSLYCICKKRTR